MKNLLKIEKDCYFIVERIKEVDPSYEIYYNLMASCFEVHSNAQARDSYCFRIPYPELDSRTIDLAYKTRVANLDALIKEMDKNNDILYEKEVKKQVNMLKEAICT